MAISKYLTLDGYIIIRASEHAVCVRKADTDTWLPRAALQDGDTLDEGDTDITAAARLVRREELET